ncbi:MAG: peptide-methionine (S)-S-oxide reductase MsrA [Alphaproteobacteria bacterium]
MLDVDKIGRPKGGLLIDPEAFPDPALDPPAPGAPGAPGVAVAAVAVLAGGCFWCTEAVFKALDGVLAVRSGYAGGTAATADYRTVCGGRTDHAEAIEVRYDPARASFGQILKIFFSVAHDPTQRDRQGNDRGRQYRSVIFHADDDQRRVAAAYIAQLDKAGVFGGPIVTTLEPLDAFYEAEDDHQDFAARNPSQPYVMFVANPKLAKLREHFPDRLKRDAG